jgi:hypothetical protein
MIPGLAAGVATAAIAAYLFTGAATSAATRTAPPTTLYAAPVPITTRGDVARSAVSPDGERVAMLTSDAVLVQPLQPGADQRVLLRGRLAYHALSWSPDGRELAVVAALGSGAPGSAAGSAPGLVVIDTETGLARRIGDNLGAVALLGGGELAAAQFADRELAFYREPDTALPVRRCPLPGPISGIRALRFDPASDALYVQVDDSDRRSSVLRIDRACSKIDVVADLLPILSFAVRPGDHRVVARLMGLHQLTEIADDALSSLGQHVIQSNEYAPLAFRRDGAIVHADRSVHWALDAIAADGARREIAGGAGESRLSLAPDGRLAQVDGVYDRGLLRVGRADLAGTGPGSGVDAGLMTTIAERVARAVWSPSGTRLAVLAQSDAGYRLAIWDAATGEMSPSRLLPGPYDVELTWLDDRRIAYPVLHERRRFAWIDVAAGPHAPTARSGAATGALITGVDAGALSLVHAHGDRRLAFMTSEPRALVVWTMIEGEPARAIARLAVDSPPSSRSPRVVWSDDDRSLIAYDAASSEMWRVDGDGNGDGRVARVPGIEPSRGGRLTRLGDVVALPGRILVATIAASSDIYLSTPLAE